MAGKSKDKARPSRTQPLEKKRNLLSSLGLKYVDYKDITTLRMFMSERGRIRSRRVTGLTVQQQRQVATAIRNAREMALLPYISAR
ncbi:30S ribosomal protein S18 [Mycobacterium sp. Aquia_213]|uniref:30S ribosomal protein S18 n=1 Tax=Mycobacterium sp. Aquia_213 TaxID=2991728 RepID=UPI002272088C|nr:30S ribosomal protein S18 [Mycobacterium sp. Aquia_213]WAC91459.1 30S ribosomal protein S18 [Mycobacterium sp. Aquia_213]